ncbi:MAG: hypothetical protein ACRDAM_22160 [Casimicrobium sp.]
MVLTYPLYYYLPSTADKPERWITATDECDHVATMTVTRDARGTYSVTIDLHGDDVDLGSVLPADEYLCDVRVVGRNLRAAIKAGVVPVDLTRTRMNEVART